MFLMMVLLHITSQPAQRSILSDALVIREDNTLTWSYYEGCKARIAKNHGFPLRLHTADKDTSEIVAQMMQDYNLPVWCHVADKDIPEIVTRMIRYGCFGSYRQADTKRARSRTTFSSASHTGQDGHGKAPLQSVVCDRGIQRITTGLGGKKQWRGNRNTPPQYHEFRAEGETARHHEFRAEGETARHHEFRAEGETARHHEFRVEGEMASRHAKEKFDIDPPNNTLTEQWVAAGNQQIRAFFLKCSANVNHRSKDGFSLLFFACYNCNRDTVTFLLDNGVDINGQNTRGETCLYNMVRSNNLEMAGYLIGKGAEVNHRTKWGDTCLQAAFCNGIPLMPDLIIAAGAEMHEIEVEYCLSIYYRNFLTKRGIDERQYSKTQFKDDLKKSLKKSDTDCVRIVTQTEIFGRSLE